MDVVGVDRNRNMSYQGRYNSRASALRAILTGHGEYHGDIRTIEEDLGLY